MAALIALAFIASAVLAAGELGRADIANLVKIDVGTEAAECSVYFGLVAEAERRSLPPGSVRDKEIEDWTRFSQEAARLSRTMLGEERALAAIKLGIEKIKRMTGNSLDNIVIANSEYAYQCKDLMDDPPKRWNYWLAKELQTERQLTPKAAPK